MTLLGFLTCRRPVNGSMVMDLGKEPEAERLQAATVKLRRVQNGICWRWSWKRSRKRDKILHTVSWAGSMQGLSDDSFHLIHFSLLPPRAVLLLLLLKFAHLPLVSCTWRCHAKIVSVFFLGCFLMAYMLFLPQNFSLSLSLSLCLVVCWKGILVRFFLFCLCSAWEPARFSSGQRWADLLSTEAGMYACVHMANGVNHMTISHDGYFHCLVFEWRWSGVAFPAVWSSLGCQYSDPSLRLVYR